MQNKRNTTIEITRMLFMIGIVTMHTFHNDEVFLYGFNKYLCIVLYSIFNMGVTFFMLITGYYGIYKNQLKRSVSLEIRILLYSYVPLIGLSIIGRGEGTSEYFRSLFPVITNRYWYITCYVMIVLLSKYINSFLDKLDKKSFQKMLLILIVFLYLAPTVFHRGISQDDVGKGLANMLTVYLIGGYLRRFSLEVDKNKYLLVSIISIALSSLLDSVVSYRNDCFYLNFSYDNSLFTLISSIGIFMYLKEKKTFNAKVNYIAKSTISVYILEGTVKGIMSKFIDISKYQNSVYYIYFMISYSVLVFIAVMCIDLIYRMIFEKYETKLAEIIDGRIIKLINGDKNEKV